MQELIKSSGLTIKQFSEEYGIPYNSVRQWANGERQAPEYLKKLIEENRKLKTKGEQLKIEEYKEVKKEKKTFPRVNYIIQWKPKEEYRIISYGYNSLEEVKKVTKTLINQDYRILIVDYEREIEINEVKKYERNKNDTRI